MSLRWRRSLQTGSFVGTVSVHHVDTECFEFRHALQLLAEFGVPVYKQGMFECAFFRSNRDPLKAVHAELSLFGRIKQDSPFENEQCVRYLRTCETIQSHTSI